MGAAAQLSVLLGLLPSGWSVCFPCFAKLKATGSWIPLGDRPPLLHACLPWSHSFHSRPQHLPCTLSTASSAQRPQSTSRLGFGGPISVGSFPLPGLNIIHSFLRADLDS